MRRAAIVAAPFAALVAACFVTIDDSKIHGASDASVDASDAGDAGADVAEAGVCPAGMIVVPVPGDAGPPYCIDETEATLDEYGAFIAAADPPAPGTQGPECTWNTTYKPPGWGNGTTGDRAVGGLDWCDAFAYCKWAGKRLCGRIGGGTVDPNGGSTNPAEGQWFNACTRGGARTYPYGSTYDAGACIGRDAVPMPQGPAPVKKATACVGGFDGIYGMSGNVAELIDSCLAEKICDGGPECELCYLVGGGFQDRGLSLGCSYINQIRRDGQYADNGVRCCSP